MRLCEVEGCGRKHDAKGMCRNHYNQSHYTAEQRHVKVVMQCMACGKDVLKHKNGGRYRVACSYECRYVLTYGRPKAEAERAKREAKALVGPIPRERTVEPSLNIIAGAGRAFISTPCEWCGEMFVQDQRVTTTPMRYCSKRCSKAKGRNARKAREHGATGSFTLAELVRVWLTFDKCCAYCEQPTVGLPDPDHVTALSRGGSNSITNILPACRMCNSDKSDYTLEEWALERLRHGKPARVTSWRSDDHRVAHLVLSAATKPHRLMALAA